MFAMKIAFARLLFRLHVALSYVRAAAHYAEHRALTKQNRIRVAARNAAAKERIALTEAAAEAA